MNGIIKAEFHLNTDTIVWDTILPDGSAYQMKWPADQFGSAMRVTPPGVRIPDKLLTEFLDNITQQQKVFPLTINTMQLPEVDQKKIDEAMAAFTEKTFSGKPK